MNKHIPLHRLTDKATIGLEIKHTADIKADNLPHKLGIHRDDHYIFFLIEEGAGAMMVDFNMVELPARHFFYLLPGQVHEGMVRKDGGGWFLAVDTLLVPDNCREIFENQLNLQLPYTLTEEEFTQARTMVGMLHNHFKTDREQVFYTPILHSLLHAYINLIGNAYCRKSCKGVDFARPHQIASAFKKQLKANYLVQKSPSWYARELNISESYLNEALRKVTGSSVTYWITKEIMLEAKRLLLYSSLNVKEIAHQLGYDDHTYFSRLFKKTENITPLSFKAQNRK